MASSLESVEFPTVSEEILREIDRIRRSISCIICLNVLNSPVAINGCGHVYCVKCIEKATEITSKCPLCGHGLSSSSKVMIIIQ